MLGIDADAILTATKAFAEGMIKNLNPTVMNLLSSFLIIDLTLSFLFDESEGLNITAGKGSSTEINVELLEKFGIDASDIAGLMAAGAGSVILDIFGVEAMATVMLLAAVGYLMFFVMLYVQILVTFVKFYLIAGYAYILIPFGVLNKTKDIALKALNGLFSQAIEIFVLIVILNLAVFIQETKWSSIISLPMNSLEAIKANLFTKFAILMFLYLLINKAGSIASSLLSGAIASIGIGAEAGARGFNNAMSAPGKVAGGMTDRASAYQKRDDGATGGAKAFRDGSRAAGAYTRAANFIKGKFKNSGSNGSNSGTTN